MYLKKDSSWIAIDFDGTVVTHKYPEIGCSVGAEAVLTELIGNGHKLILNTMRSGKELAEAVRWFLDRNIFLSGVNKNPTQESWTSSPKVEASLYIDDAALNCPLVKTPVQHLTGPRGAYNKVTRPYVDWVVVRELLLQEGYL